MSGTPHGHDPSCITTSATASATTAITTTTTIKSTASNPSKHEPEAASFTTPSTDSPASHNIRSLSQSPLHSVETGTLQNSRETYAHTGPDADQDPGRFVPRPKASMTLPSARQKLYQTPDTDHSLPPKERLNALLASAVKPQAITSRSVSSPSMNVAAQRQTSPTPVHPVNARVAQAAAVRTSSMDSALSSVSSASANVSTSTQNSVLSSQETPKPHKSSSKSEATASPSPASSPSAAALLATATSPEAAVQKLLRESKKINDKNEQLWKLVEKQRSMILGLNKDLELALKEKERYRRKYKEVSNAVAAAPDSTVARAHADSVASSVASRAVSSHNHVTSTDTATSIATPVDMTRSSSREAEPASIPGMQPEELVPTMPLVSEDAPAIAAGTETPSATPAAATATTATATTATTATTTAAPPTAPTSPRTPQQATYDKQTTFSSPGEKTRKAAPAPLDLAKTQAQPHLTRIVKPPGMEDDDDEDSASDYDGPRPEDFGRGRRRTRADDDSYREAVAMEEERRSRSNKSAAKSKSKTKGTKTPDEPQVASSSEPGDTAAPAEQPKDLPPSFGGLPISPRANLLGGLQSPLPASMGSIASQMQPAAQPQEAPIAAPQLALPAKSPGLPMSPRPSDRPPNSPMPRTPMNALGTPGPMSPRGAMGMPLTPRAPRHPIPLPQNNPLAAQAPHLARAANQYVDPAAHASSMAEILQAQSRTSVDRDGQASPTEERTGHIFRGFVSEEFPKLLLPPNALPLIYVQVFSSRLRPSRAGTASLSAKVNNDEDQIFTLAIHSRSDHSQLWRIEKTLTAFSMLDQTLRASGSLKGKNFDRSIFSGHSPAKVDARRAALNDYFENVLDTPLDSKSAEVLCHFFSSNAIGPHVELSSPSIEADAAVEAVSGPSSRRKKEGYLAKKGKQFGGWKARYFVLEDRFLHYYESQNVSQLGTIKLASAQIAKQNPKDAEEEDEFRHAFVILEPKRKDSSNMVRHVLCAESDAERDEWVDALMQHVGTTLPLSAMTPTVSQGPTPKRTGSRKTRAALEEQQFQTVSYEETVPAETPVLGSAKASTDSPITDISSSANLPHHNISGPVSGAPIQNSAAWGNKTMPSPTTMSREHRKRSMFGFMSRASEDNSNVQKPGRSRSPRRGPIRPVFGMPLADAAELCAPEGIDICLPAPVYRCIEYLEAKNASLEEGIFRLSGSNTVVKGLKDKFNTEGDFRLVDGPYYDIHAIASLLKLYLRELPESILTRRLHLDFLRVLETEDKKSRIAAFNVLVHRLPEANLELLATLARFLIDIVNHCDVNLMNARNVGIVFSPTLNIPAPLISLLLSDYDSIFADPDQSSAAAASPVLEGLAGSGQESPMDLRSPRKQMFQELPTPGLSSPQFQSMMSPGLPRNPAEGRAQFSRGGFAPSQSSHESRAPPQPLTQVSQDAYGSLNAALSSGAPLNKSTTVSSDETSTPRTDISEDQRTYERLAGPTKVSGVVTTTLPAEVAAFRRGKRESALMGSNSGDSASTAGVDSRGAARSGDTPPPLPAAGAAASNRDNSNSNNNSLEGRRKSSYQRLREIAGMRE